MCACSPLFDIFHPQCPQFFARPQRHEEPAQRQRQGQGGIQWCWSVHPRRNGRRGSGAFEDQPVLCADSPAAGIGKCAHGSARAVHMHAQRCRLAGLRCRTCDGGGWWRPSECVCVAGSGTGGIQRHMLRGGKHRSLHAQAGARMASNAVCCQ